MEITENGIHSPTGVEIPGLDLTGIPQPVETPVEGAPAEEQLETPKRKRKHRHHQPKLQNLKLRKKKKAMNQKQRMGH